jgi:hypothetical protein
MALGAAILGLVGATMFAVPAHADAEAEWESNARARSGRSME